jgi:hypothetical protein
MAEYDSDFADQVLDQLIAGGFEREEYSFSIEPGLGTPPVLEVIRFVNDFANREKQEMIARFCIMNKTVKLLVNGEPFGSGFILTDINAPWDVFPEFKSHPLSLELLMDVCGAHTLKNSGLSLKKKPVATAQP